MPAYVIVVDICGLALIAVGFIMAFRQDLVRRILYRNGAPGRPTAPHEERREDGQDPLTYVLRIAGVMVMTFGLTVGGMITLFHLA